MMVLATVISLFLFLESLSSPVSRLMLAWNSSKFFTIKMATTSTISSIATIYIMEQAY